LAKHVGGWSLPKIGRFYNGRHHTTVLYAIRKIEKLRKTDQTFDALLDVLTAALLSEGRMYEAGKAVSPAHTELIDAIAERVIHRLKEMPTVDATRIEAATVTELVLGGSLNGL